MEQVERGTTMYITPTIIHDADDIKADVRNALVKKSLKRPTTEFAALIRGEYGTIVRAEDKTRYSLYVSQGFTHVMSALDGNVMELY
ncbi:MAG: hypothetical protein KH138_03580 [Firmicutes bacterium]|nr:hypothetical protein [Bacillota bacterium]